MRYNKIYTENFGKDILDRQLEKGQNVVYCSTDGALRLGTVLKINNDGKIKVNRKDINKAVNIKANFGYKCNIYILD